MVTRGVTESDTGVRGSEELVPNVLVILSGAKDHYTGRRVRVGQDCWERERMKGESSDSTVILRSAQDDTFLRVHCPSDPLTSVPNPRPLPPDPWSLVL